MLCMRHLEKYQFIIYSDISDVDTAHCTISPKPGFSHFTPGMSTDSVSIGEVSGSVR